MSVGAATVLPNWRNACARVGLAFANGLSLALIFLPLLCVTVYRIRVEEEALLAHFGAEYAAYASETKRLVPGIY